jgi:hypothetical protein
MSNSATTFAGARAENFNAVFLGTNGFAETITQYPKGVTSSPVSVTAIVHKSEEGETPVDDEDGSRVVRWIVITLAAAGQPGGVTVTIAERKQQRDQFLIDGELWDAEKIVSRTAYAQRVRLKRTEAASTKKTRLR